MRVPPFVPEGLARTTIELRGAAGAEWLERLPAIVARCEERWSLAVGPPFPELSYNYAAPVVRADGTAAEPVRARQLELLAGEGVPVRRGRVDLSAVGWP